MFNTVILIPAYNEKKSLSKILHNINTRFKVIVIDDCSTDGTIELLKSKKFEFLRNKSNLGYEYSLKKGILFIKKKYKKIKNIITFDADGEHKINDLMRLYKYQKKKNYYVIVGNRKKLNRFSEYIISKIFKIKYNIIDPLSGLKLYKAEKIFYLCNKISNHFFLVDLLIEFINNKFKIGNLNIICNKIDRKPKVGSCFFTNLKILHIIKIL